MQRQTRQRDAIRDAFIRAERPLSPQEVLHQAQYRSPNLGIATVYRNLKTLVASGWLRPVELPGTPDRYELADRGHHHHFHCRCCDRVYDIDGCPGDLQDLCPPGFQLESHEIILYGLCRNCKVP
ncbi:MAG: transcriptional repressor [Acidobacteriota bacterium]